MSPRTFVHQFMKLKQEKVLRKTKRSKRRKGICKILVDQPKIPFQTTLDPNVTYVSNQTPLN